MLSYYQILQVEESASDAEIKQAYRSLSKVLHPDLNDNSAEANTIFRLLQEAYETLSNPLKRKAYDIDPNPIGDDDDSRIKSYKEQNNKQGIKLEEYEKMLKEYKETVYLKSERERELNKEISSLKKRILEIEKIAAAKLEQEKQEQNSPVEVIQNEKREFSWPMMILIIVGANVALFLAHLAIFRVFGISV